LNEEEFTIFGVGDCVYCGSWNWSYELVFHQWYGCFWFRKEFYCRMKLGDCDIVFLKGLEVDGRVWCIFGRLMNRDWKVLGRFGRWRCRDWKWLRRVVPNNESVIVCLNLKGSLKRWGDWGMWIVHKPLVHGVEGFMREDCWGKQVKFSAFVFSYHWRRFIITLNFEGIVAKVLHYLKGSTCAVW
jgi:hypothetical protein